MMTRTDVAHLSETLGNQLVMSVYIAKENVDPGMAEPWKRRFETALGTLRADVEERAPAELVLFDRAADSVMATLGSFGRILPSEGWCGFATADKVWHAEELPFRPSEMVRWRDGIYVAPYVRALKNRRPVILGLLDRWHAEFHRYENGELSLALEIEADQESADASDVGVSKRASASTGTRGASGMRGMTGTDYAQRAQAEEARRLRDRVVEAVKDLAGDDGSVVLGGTREAAGAMRKELQEQLSGRVIEVPELSFDTGRDELVAHLRQAASRLTEARQSQLLESCADPRYGSTGWNETYRALAAGAVDTLLLARAMIADAPEDAERLARLAIAQGGDVEEVGGELGEQLMAGEGGIAARLRFVPASLQG